MTNNRGVKKPALEKNDRAHKLAMAAIKGAYSHIVDNPADRPDGDYLSESDMDAIRILDDARRQVQR
jgi:hypothetical protein